MPGAASSAAAERVYRIGAGAAIALALSALVGCGQTSGAAANGAATRPPAEVGVVTVAARPVPVTTELPGRVEAFRVAEVRARVAGIVLERVFSEGSDVEAGETLFRIDPAPFQAALDAAEAALARAEANELKARLRAERYAPLVETRAVSQQDYDDAAANLASARADVAAAKAALTTARLNRSYANVTSPISGRIGRAEVTEGALVGQGTATLMATVRQLDPVYVNVAQSSAELLELRRALVEGRLATAGDGGAAVTVVRSDGTEHPHAGKLLFTDVAVDESTGAVNLRAEVPNPDGALLPGEFVRARLAQAVVNDAITVPQQALNRTADGASVIVVGPDGAAARRAVEVGDAVGDEWLVTGGLVAGEQVIVEGLQKVRPGAPVKPVPFGADE